MGLDIKIKGLEHKSCLHISYTSFAEYRKLLARAYDLRLGELYEKAMLGIFTGKWLSSDEIKEWDNLCNEDLDILLWHSDCDGKLTVKECRKVYEILKEYDFNLFPFPFNEMHKKFLSNLKFCIDNKRNMYFC